MKKLGICYLALFCIQYINAECDFQTGSYLSELSSPRSINEIIIEIPKSGKFNKNFAKIISSRSVNIPSDLKKNFKANVMVRYSFGSCTFEAVVRQHGDLRDHIQFLDNKPSRSLRVSLKNGNILNAVKFKLLIPDTRNDLNEILGTVLLKQLGFITPETFQVKTSINNVKSVMLFQEDISKELLERNLKREGPLFEGDESMLWSNKGYELFELQKLALARLVNPDWFMRGSSSQSISLEAFQKIQRAYLEATLRIPANKLTIFPNNKESNIFSDYFFIMLAMNGEHALNLNNRSYYYNSFSNEFEPIYYDGDFKLEQEVNLNNKLYSETFNQGYIFPFSGLFNNDAFIKKAFESYISRILFFDKKEDLFFKRSVESILKNILKMQSQINTISENLESTNNIDVLYKYYVASEKSNNFMQTKIIAISKFNEELYLARDSSDSILYLNHEELSKLISKNFYNNKRSVYIPTDHPENYSHLNEVIKESFLEGSILYSKNIKITANISKKIIDINQSASNSWVLFKNMELMDWTISFSGIPSDNIQSNTQRFNNAGMTGCLNFYDVSFNNVDILIKDGKCEDSLNIVNSSGKIEEINIYKSYADAIDFDFSNLTIKSITVMEAGNDCLDVSGGSYFVDLVNLQTCSDKGISVGEKSQFLVNTANIYRSTIGVASKDLSVFELNHGNFIDTITCINAYQKKQEFGGSIAKYKNIICDGNFITDKNSIIQQQ